jgi:hypothetical protein
VGLQPPRCETHRYQRLYRRLALTRTRSGGWPASGAAGRVHEVDLAAIDALVFWASDS